MRATEAPVDEEATLKIRYLFDSGSRFTSLNCLSGWTVVEINGLRLFEFAPTEVDVQKIDPRTVIGDNGGLYWCLHWLLVCLPEHLSYHNCPEGPYKSGIDVYRRYKYECLFPTNMLPIARDEEPEPVVEDPVDEWSDHERGATVYLSYDVDPFDAWMNHHLLDRPCAGTRDVCVQRWPATRDYVEISWGFEKNLYLHPRGRAFVPVHQYVNEVIASSEAALETIESNVRIPEYSRDQFEQLKQYLRAAREAAERLR